MNKSFTAEDFDTVEFMSTGDESQALIDAKAYLKDIQMTINIGDVQESLKGYSHERALFKLYEESVFSKQSLDFLQRVKFMTSFEGLNTSMLEKAPFMSTKKENYAFLQRNLIKQTKEFITAIWDCVLLIKMAHAKQEETYLLEAFNAYFAQLTKENTGDASHYQAHNNLLDMITELVLFMQTYLSDYIIFALKAHVGFESKKSVETANRKFVKVLQKSQKIALRFQMFEQIKSKNHILLLKLLLDQKHEGLR